METKGVKNEQEMIGIQGKNASIISQIKNEDISSFKSEDFFGDKKQAVLKCVAILLEENSDGQEPSLIDKPDDLKNKMREMNFKKLTYKIYE